MASKKELKFEINQETKCWIVKSHKTNSGGYVYVNQAIEKEYIHRIVYRDKIGEIPPKTEVRHLCGNKICINPEHLVLFSRNQLQKN
jgi:hypothetical protein